jgi:predicted SAM-dependent methyltransferase
MSTETEKIRPRALKYIKDGNTVLDIGCGSDKIVPWADTVDQSPHAYANIRADISPADDSLKKALNGKLYDVVFSSHALEHVKTPILETLNYWLSFAKQSGFLVLYLPDESHYVFDSGNPKRRNPEHFHYLTKDTFKWFIEQLQGTELLEYEHDLGPDRYSFFAVLKKF